MIKKLLFWLIILSKTPLFAQESTLVNFKLLAQNDAVENLESVKNKTTYQTFKFLKLGDSSYLSFGGSYRFQAEHFTNENFQNIPAQDKIWLLNRGLVHAKFVSQNKLELFAELGTSTVLHKTDVSPVDKDLLYINQLFIKYHLAKNLSVSLGRENLKFGSRRLVDIREGPNVRRSFDLIRLDYNADVLTITPFFSIPVKPRPLVFDNESLNTAEYFAGIYLTRNFNFKHNLDFYLLYKKKDDASYLQTIEDEKRYSIGTRYFGSTSHLNYNIESVYQLGSYGKQSISAWTFSTDLFYTYKLINTSKNLSIGLKAEFISGDKNPDNSTLGTFDALYPRGAYFGRVARFGPSNLIDIHPYLNYSTSKYYLEFDYDAFWKYSNSDDVYDASLNTAYISDNKASMIANQFGALIGFNFRRTINIEWENNLIVPEKFLTSGGWSSTLFHTVLTLEIKF